jgi:hypothetical protein
VRKTQQARRDALAALQTRLEKKDSLRREYAKKPTELLAKYGYRFMGPMRDLFLDIYFGRVDRAIGLAGRGGGKSCEAGGLATALFLLDDWNVGIVSGSREQALRVIEYVQDITGDEEVGELIAEETKTVVKAKAGNWIKAAPASTKAIRGLHAKGRKMLLILDEEAEMDPAIVRASLSVVSDAKRAVVLRLSTMHKLEGTFAELVARHEQMGYRLYRWDSFDVATRCTTKDCADCLKAFRAGNEPEEIARLTREFHERYCRERAKDPKREPGWIKVETIRQNYMEMPLSWFETEVMALKPSGEGKVLPYDLVKEVFETSELAAFVPGAPIWGWVDWGFKGQMTAGIYQQQGDAVALLDAECWTGVDIELLESWFRGKEQEYGQELCEVDPDSSHPFENNRLREAGWQVNEAVFGAFKETGAGYLKWLFERRRLRVAARFPKVLEQLLGWSRGADGRIKKGNDHFCDGMLAGMKRMAEAVRTGPGRVLRLPAGMKRDGGSFLDVAARGGERVMDRMTQGAEVGDGD